MHMHDERRIAVLFRDHTCLHRQPVMCVNRIGRIVLDELTHIFAISALHGTHRSDTVVVFGLLALLDGAMIIRTKIVIARWQRSGCQDIHIVNIWMLSRVGHNKINRDSVRRQRLRHLVTRNSEAATIVRGKLPPKH